MELPAVAHQDGVDNYQAKHTSGIEDKESTA